MIMFILAATTMFFVGATKAEAVEIKDEVSTIAEQSIQVKAVGWTKIDGKWYHYTQDGNLTKGWFKDTDNKWYYLNPNTGVMHTGWTQVNGYWYYLNEKTGEMLTGWIKVDGKSYYMSSSGSMHKGWFKDTDGKSYYLNLTDGHMETAWINIDGKDYYMNTDGSYYKGNKIVSEARIHLGKPYVYGAVGPNSFDCSGLTQYVYKRLGYNLSRTTYTQVKEGIQVSQANLLPGDLVFTEGSISSPTHVGIYIGGGKMIHAPKPGDVVKVSNVYKFVTARRIIK